MSADPVRDVLAELARAESLHPAWPTDPLHALDVLGEEFGELTKAMLDLVYSPAKATREDVRSEAIQTAAMALRLVINLDRYRYERCEQRSERSATEEPPKPPMPASPPPTPQLDAAPSEDPDEPADVRMVLRDPFAVTRLKSRAELVFEKPGEPRMVASLFIEVAGGNPHEREQIAFLIDEVGELIVGEARQVCRDYIESEAKR